MRSFVPPRSSGAGAGVPVARVAPSGRSSASRLGVTTASTRMLPSGCGRTRPVRSAPEPTSRSSAARSGTVSVTSEAGSGSAGLATAGSDGSAATNVVSTIARTTADAREPRIGSSGDRRMAVIEGRTGDSGKTQGSVARVLR
ncbi:hypothetical protein ACFSTC_25485 [Nonomuraea ferruginea]